MKTLAICMAAVLLALGACQPPVSNGAATIEAGNAFILEPAGGRDVTMGGVDLSAEGGDFRLVGARSTVARQIEIHTMSMDDGTMRMRKVEAVTVPDGETVQLKRGGDHLMIFGVEPLALGEKHMIELVFIAPDGSETVTQVAAVVRGLDD
jgi:periplasmic copper chaperone A